MTHPTAETATARQPMVATAIPLIANQGDALGSPPGRVGNDA
jgi:hypothetical protein